MKIRALLFAVLTAMPALAAAQSSYPSKPVRIMVGANAGGGTDIIARMLAEKMAAALPGSSFIVENRPGASNTIAADLTAKAPADGHTMLVATNTGQAIAPHLLKLKFDPMKDLAPVGLVVTVPNVLVVGPSVKAASVAELVAAMKARPGQFRYASSGVGSTQHLAGEGFKLAASVDAVHVPYKGSSQAHLDIMSGNVELMFDTTSSAMAQIRAGKLRALAMTTSARSAELPDVPTLSEAGVAGFEMSTWYAMFTTAGVPAEVLSRLQNVLASVLQLPDVQAKLKSLGGEPGAMSPADFAKLNRQEFERFGELIRKANISL
jgi:tripartite-type tricarboxylate transporter receptor subunit TctC